MAIDQFSLYISVLRCFKADWETQNKTENTKMCKLKWFYSAREKNKIDQKQDTYYIFTYDRSNAILHENVGALENFIISRSLFTTTTHQNQSQMTAWFTYYNAHYVAVYKTRKTWWKQE